VSISIPRAALDSIFDECDKYNADETGGRLIGTYCGKSRSYEIKVSGVIGPGPNAQRSGTSFFQDGSYQEEVFRSVEARHPEVEHLGNWHTHHVNGYPTLSGGDIATYRNIVNHQNHNTDFFYALLVVGKNAGRGSRYDVKHYFFRRSDETVYEVPPSDVRIVECPLISPHEPDPTRHNAGHSVDKRQSPANPERAKDKEFFDEFYPELKALFSEKIGAPYWKGPLTLVDGSTVDIVAVESAGGATLEYSIITSPDNQVCTDAASAYKERKFPAARHAVLRLEKDLNQVVYRNRK
jgi:hypothetical protein